MHFTCTVSPTSCHIAEMLSKVNRLIFEICIINYAAATKQALSFVSFVVYFTTFSAETSQPLPSQLQSTKNTFQFSKSPKTTRHRHVIISSPPCNLVSADISPIVHYNGMLTANLSKQRILQLQIMDLMIPCYRLPDTRTQLSCEANHRKKHMKKSILKQIKIVLVVKNNVA